MLKSYLTIALRHMQKEKVYTTVSVLGLGLGMAVCLLTWLFVLDHLNYDQHNEKADRVVRVLRERTITSGTSLSPRISGAFGPALQESFPEIESTVRLIRARQWLNVGSKTYRENILMTEASFFDVFTLPLIEGTYTALDNKGSIIISQSAAHRIFGSKNPINQTLTIESRSLAGNYKIVGIFADIPRKSTLNFDFLTTTQSTYYVRGNRGYWNIWIPDSDWRPLNLYALLKPGVSKQAIETRLPEFIERHMGAEVRKNNRYFLQPLNRIYLYMNQDYDRPGMGRIETIYMLGGIALFVLIIASVNFVNLSVARSANRAREVGIRKVTGAYPKHLISQFVGEAVLTAFIAGVVALLLSAIALPHFNTLIQKNLAVETIGLGTLMLSPLLLICIVGLFAGCYPAFVISRIKPAIIAKQNTSGQHPSALRKALVVFQFAISIILLLGTMVVSRQIDYISDRSLGFDKSHQLVLSLFSTDRTLNKRYETIKNEFLRHPNILKASASHSTMIGSGGQLETVKAEGVTADYQMRVLMVDHDFLGTYDLELATGRFLKKGGNHSRPTEFVLNEAAVRALNWTDPIGKSLTWGRATGPIVGIVKDFHNRSLREAVEPVFLCKRSVVFNRLTLKVSPRNIEETMAFVKNKWSEFIPHRPFNGFWLDQEIDERYWQEQRLKQVTQLTSGIAIFIACLGLFALAALTVQSRTKEIGIRKVLGASSSSVISLISKDFVKLVLLANIIAWPIAYFSLSHWLNGFQYRTNLDLWPFIITATITLFIALFTVGYHALRAATINPVDAIQHE